MEIIPVTETRKWVRSKTKKALRSRSYEPFTDLELAFGYTAYLFWYHLEAQKKLTEYDTKSESAKAVALIFIEKCLCNPKIEPQVKFSRFDYNALGELRLAEKAGANSDTSEYNLSLTRSIILIVEALAKRRFGQKLALGLAFESQLIISVAWITDVTILDVAKNIWTIINDIDKGWQS